MTLMEAMQLFPSICTSDAAAFSSTCFCLPTRISFALSRLALTLLLCRSLLLLGIQKLERVQIIPLWKR